MRLDVLAVRRGKRGGKKTSLSIMGGSKTKGLDEFTENNSHSGEKGETNSAYDVSDLKGKKTRESGENCFSQGGLGNKRHSRKQKRKKREMRFSKFPKRGNAGPWDTSSRNHREERKKGGGPLLKGIEEGPRKPSAPSRSGRGKKKGLECIALLEGKGGEEIHAGPRKVLVGMERKGGKSGPLPSHIGWGEKGEGESRCFRARGAKSPKENRERESPYPVIVLKKGGAGNTLAGILAQKKDVYLAAKERGEKTDREVRQPLCN